VDVLFLVEQQAAALKVADDVAVGLFDPAALVLGRFGGERAVGRNRADQRRAIAIGEPGLLGQQQIEIDFAEGRGLVDTPVPVSTVTNSAGTTRQATCWRPPCFSSACVSPWVL